MSNFETKRSGIEFRWIIFGKIRASGWQDIGDGYFADQESVSYGLQVGAQNIITSVRPDPDDETGLIVTDMVLMDKEARKYVDRKFLISVKDVERLRDLTRSGFTSMEVRRGS